MKNKVLCIIVLLSIFVLTAGLLFLPKKEYSAQENRYLESFPEITLESVVDGSFMQDFETYLSDHFPFRDVFMTIQSRYQRLLGRNQIGEIYIGRDGYYIEEYKEPQNTARIMSVFSGLEKKVTSADVTFMLVPTAVTIYADKLPKNTRNASQTEELDKIYSSLESVKVDVTTALMKKKEEYPLYYKLDHHWTSYGAYVAYEEYCKAKDIISIPINSFQTEVVSDNFQGTISSKLNDSYVGADEITVFSLDNSEITVNYLDTGEISDSPYAPKYLETKDQYSYFLNNIHPMIEINNPQASSENCLAVIKDSYANCLVPFLMNHYQKIYVVDPRYYKSSISKFINENEEITDVLVLYNMNTIDEDLGIGGIY